MRERGERTVPPNSLCRLYISTLFQMCVKSDAICTKNSSSTLLQISVEGSAEGLWVKNGYAVSMIQACTACKSITAKFTLNATFLPKYHLWLVHALELQSFECWLPIVCSSYTQCLPPSTGVFGQTFYYIFLTTE